MCKANLIFRYTWFLSFVFPFLHLLIRTNTFNSCLLYCLHILWIFILYLPDIWDIIIDFVFALLFQTYKGFKGYHNICNLMQGLMQNHDQIAEYFRIHGVSIIFLFRRNLLRRMISVLANEYDRNAKLLNGTHKSHVHSPKEVSLSVCVLFVHVLHCDARCLS